jgi:hypothetical protein
MRQPAGRRIGGIAARRELVKDALEKGNARSRDARRHQPEPFPRKRDLL